ncbi:MAG: DNA-binding protein [Thermodesulfobacteriota bacterium]
MKDAKKVYLTAVLAVGLAVSGCSDQGDKKAAAPAPAAQQEAAVQAPSQEVKQVPPVQVAEAATLEGTVLETFDSGGYTYIHLDTGSEKLWAAAGQTTVAVGDKVSLQNGPVMTDFYSKTLDRTFPEIIFSGGCQVAGAQKGAAPAGKEAAPAGFAEALQGEGAAPMTPPAGIAAEDASGGSVKAVTPVQEVKVDKAEGENGYRVEEVHAKAAELAGKTVKIRGKVVKVSPNIMGRNWIHLQDGTGDAMKNSHDLVVTTSETAELNAVVMIEGVVAKDKDFGAGYFYDVLVEEAKITQ